MMQSIAGRSLDMLAEHAHVQLEPSLHLSVSKRSFRAENLSKFVQHLLDLDTDEAHEIYQTLEHYPVVLTRSLSQAKRWLKSQARGSVRRLDRNVELVAALLPGDLQRRAAVESHLLGRTRKSALGNLHAPQHALVPRSQFRPVFYAEFLSEMFTPESSTHISVVVATVQRPSGTVYLINQSSRRILQFNNFFGGLS